MRSVYGLVSRYVQDPRLRVVFSFHPLLIGGNPFRTTSIYCLIAFLERRWGVHFAMGGTGPLVQGLVGLIEGQGGEVRCSAAVAEITRRWRRARPASRCASGEAHRGRHRGLQRRFRLDLPPAAGDRRRAAAGRTASSSARSYSMSLFVWYFGTNRHYPDVAHHTILLGPRYRELLDDIFRHKVLADDFSLYLHRPTATDPSLAPPGCDAFYVLSPVPHLAGGTDWAARGRALPAGDRARHLAATVLPGLEDEIVTSRMLTPQDFQDRLLLLPRRGASGWSPC